MGKHSKVTSKCSSASSMRNFHMYFSGTGHAVMKPFLLLFYIKSGARLDNTSYGKGEKKTSCHWNSVSVGAESLTVLWLLLCWVLRWLLNILSAKTKTKKCAENKSCMICFESHIVWYKSRFPFPFFFFAPCFFYFHFSQIPPPQSSYAEGFLFRSSSCGTVHVIRADS